MSKTRTYNPSEVTLIFGVNIIDGFTSGTFINIGLNNPAVTLVPGINSPSRTLSADSTGTCVVTLDQTSPSNDVLTAAYLADRAGGIGIFPLTVKDGSGRTINFAEHAWVQIVPAQTYANEISTREWTLGIGDLDLFVGGND
jgi:hypothetical protein